MIQRSRGPKGPNLILSSQEHYTAFSSALVAIQQITNENELGRLGFTPNGLTLVGFGIAIIAAILAGLQLWFPAGLIVVFGGVFDLFERPMPSRTDRRLGLLRSQHPFVVRCQLRSW